MKNVIFAVIAAIMGVVFSLLAAEVVLRFLPVNEGARAQAVNEENPIFRFLPNREFTYAHGWNFDIVTQLRTNNYGFVNARDYRPDGAEPLLAVIGDSFVEALQVPLADSLSGRLAESVAGCGRVYSFAASGAGLAQYLAWARFARDTFHPQAATFVIIGNDFSESLYHRERGPGFHSFERQADDTALLRLNRYEPSMLRKLLRSSALARYLFTQLKVHAGFSVNISLGRHDSRYAGNVEAVSSEEVMQEAKWAADRFLDLAPEYSGLPSQRIQLVVEGIRPEVYDPKELEAARQTFWGRMREYMLAEGTRRGYEVIDLNVWFARRFARDGKRFEAPTEGHWNSEGHAAVAEAIRTSQRFQSAFAGCPRPVAQ